MSSTISPNMSLIVPTVGSENGPQYATDINNSLSIIDGHNHSPGSGVQITPAGLNINADLSLNNNFLTNIAGLKLSAQGSTPANNTVYESGVDLYYVDGNGNNVRITQSGGIAGSPGSIANLTSPASATYVSATKTFVWQSDTGVAANMDAGSLLLRNLSPNSTFALTLAPPASLSNNYTVTLPVVPASQSFMTIDNSGSIAAPVVYPLIASGIANHVITTTQISNSANILGSQLSASANILGSQLSASANITGSQILAVTNINPFQLASYDSINTPFYGSTSLSGSFSTASTSYVHVTGLDATLATSTTARPVFIHYTGSLSVNITGGAGTLGISLQVRAINGLASTTIATYAATAPANSSITLPLGSINSVDFFANGPVYQLWIEMTTTNTATGTVSIANGSTCQVLQV